MGLGTAPVVFTSVNDNTVGGATGSGSPAPGDYFAAIDVDGGGSVDVTDASFSYAQDGIGPGAGASSVSVSVSGGSFDHDDQGVDLGAQEGAGTGSLSVSGAEFAGDQTGVVTEGWGLALSGSRFTGSAVAAVIAEGVPDLSKVVLARPERVPFPGLGRPGSWPCPARYRRRPAGRSPRRAERSWAVAAGISPSRSRCRAS